MAVSHKVYPVEHFGTRLDWIMDHLDPDPAVAQHIRTKADLWRHVSETVELPINMDRTWRRCHGAEGHRVPHSFVVGIVKVFPDLNESMLTTPRHDDFLRQVEPVLAARARWIRAAKYLAGHRHALASLAKRYHTPAYEPEFPLLVQPGWLLATPKLLDESDELPKFETCYAERQPSRLEGLNVDYVNLKSRLMPKNKTPHNGDGYRVVDIDVNGGDLNISFGPSKYFQYVNSCEAMAVELADYALRNPAGVPTPHDLTMRGPPKALFEYKERSALAGVNCILMLKNYFRGVFSDERRRMRNMFVLHKRGERTLEAQNTIHVVPAGSHQPLSVDFGDEREVSIWHTAVREFCEEIFNKEEASRIRSHGEDFLSHPDVAPHVDAFFRKKAAHVYLLGIGLDPITTKPEILVAIVVDWQKAITRIDGLKIDENYEGDVRLIDLSRERLRDEALRPRLGESVLPAGAACMLMAAKHFDLLMDGSH